VRLLIAPTLYFDFSKFKSKKIAAENGENAEKTRETGSGECLSGELDSLENSAME
jgi:hypothetical protein